MRERPIGRELLVLVKHKSHNVRDRPRPRQTTSSATLLVDLVRRHVPDSFIKGFHFKAVRPTFDLHPFRLSGKPSPDGKTVQLWAQDHEGWLTMQGTAELD